MPTRRQYGYDPKTEFYFYETNQKRMIIQPRDIRLDLSRFSHGVRDELKDITRAMVTGKIPPQEWYDRTAHTMKIAYRASVDVSRGDNKEMNQDERNRWLALLLLLFFLLNDIADGINEGTIEIDNHLIVSASLRGGAAWSLFENWRLASHLQKGLAEGLKKGYRECRRVLGIAEHCEPSGDRPGCVELADLGWMPIEKMVPIGAATCRDHCQCHLEFRGKRIEF